MRRAFTLVEILLTLALLGLIIAFVFPELGGDIGRRSLSESADRLRSLVLMAHADAMHSGLKYRIEFPGTPDPLDPHADKTVAVPTETQQPTVKRQSDALSNPDTYGDFEAAWKSQPILQEGTRCVAVMPGRPSFEVDESQPISGPSIAQENETIFVPLTLGPDGTCDWVTFVLTDLPADKELGPEDATHILNVIVDGRTGQTWVQRALQTEEVKLLAEKGASPILHVDFTSSQLITEQNILEIHVRPGGASSGGAGPQQQQPAPAPSQTGGGQ
jgi:prepilin-type N-terminal cleavage/methylation domain-containing protein